MADSKVYLKGSGPEIFQLSAVNPPERRLVPDMETFQLLGGSVLPMPDPVLLSAYKAGAPLPSRKQGTFIRAEGKIYIMQGGHRRLIPDMETFHDIGGMDGAWSTCSGADIDEIPSGVNLPSKNNQAILTIRNQTNDPLTFECYSPGDRLYLVATAWRNYVVPPRSMLIWDNASKYKDIQIIFGRSGKNLQPKLVPVTLLTFCEDNTVVLGESPATILDKVEHFVVVMLENRSFDNLLGWLYADNQNHPPHNIPAQSTPTFDGLLPNHQYSNRDSKNNQVFATKDIAGQKWFKTPNPNPHEVYPAFLEQMFGTRDPAPGQAPDMSGFLKNYEKACTSGEDPKQIMKSYSPEQLPVLSQLARNFAVCDRWFGSVPCETWPNRSFVHAGSSFGRLNNLDSEDNDTGVPNFNAYAWKRTIFDVLSDHDVRWSVYSDSMLLSTLANFQFTNIFKKIARPAYGTPQFEEDAKNGTLPTYSFLEPEYAVGATDEHPGPGCDMRRGEDFLLRIWKAVSQGAAWKRTLMLIVFDEHGGCYDHVPPPATATPPDDSAPQFAKRINPFKQYGPRVPAVLVSPYIEAGTVFRSGSSSVEYDHTSVLATLRDWIFRREVPTDWLASKRIEKAPTLWNVLTRETPREDIPDIRIASTGISKRVMRPENDNQPPTDLQLGVIVLGEAERRFKLMAESNSLPATAEEQQAVFTRIVAEVSQEYLGRKADSAHGSA